MARTTHDKYGSRTSAFRGEQFVLGDKRSGYSIYRRVNKEVGPRAPWHSVVWNEGSAVREDLWPDRVAAIDYALGRAAQHGVGTRRSIAKAREAAGITWKCRKCRVVCNDNRSTCWSCGGVKARMVAGGV